MTKLLPYFGLKTTLYEQHFARCVTLCKKKKKRVVCHLFQTRFLRNTHISFADVVGVFVDVPGQAEVTYLHHFIV